MKGDAAEVAEGRRSFPIKRIVGYLLVVVCVALFVQTVDVHLLLNAFRDISLIDILKLASISFLLIYVSVLKWRAFLQRVGIDASLGKLLRLYVIGYFVNLVMPSYVGGDVVRSLSLGKGVDRTHALSATFLERYTGLISMLLMAMLAAVWSPSVTVEIRSAVLVLTVGSLAATAFLLGGCTSWLSTRCRIPPQVVTRVRKMEEALRWGVRDRRLLVKAFTLSFLFHVLTIVNTAVCASAVGWHTAQLFDLSVVVPLILVAGAIPLSPQGLGVQEGLFLYFLHGVGATSEQALAVGLVLRAKSYVLAGIGGVLWGVRGRKGEGT